MQTHWNKEVRCVKRKGKFYYQSYLPLIKILHQLNFVCLMNESKFSETYFKVKFQLLKCLTSANSTFMYTSYSIWNLTEPDIVDFIKEMKRNCGELSVHLLLNNGGNFYSKSDRIYNIKKYKMQRTRKGPYSICQNIKASHTITSCVRSIFFFLFTGAYSSTVSFILFCFCDVDNSGKKQICLNSKNGFCATL